MFLHDMCLPSSFKNDYILIADLKKAYDSYCSNYGIAGVKKEPIEGSRELSEFGAKIDSIPIPYILNVMIPVGMINDLVNVSDDALFFTGFVRKNNLPKKSDLSRW